MTGREQPGKGKPSGDLFELLTRAFAGNLGRSPGIPWERFAIGKYWAFLFVGLLMFLVIALLITAFHG